MGCGNSIPILPRRKNYWLFSGDELGVLKQWNYAKRKLYKNHGKIHKTGINLIFKSPLSKYLFTCDESGFQTQWTINKFHVNHEYGHLHTSPILSGDISKDSKFLITGTESGDIKKFCIETGKEIHHFQDAHQDSVTSIVAAPDETYFYSCCLKKISQWNIQKNELVYQFTTVDNSYRIQSSFRITPNSKFLISFNRYGNIEEWDITNKASNGILAKVDKITNMVITCEGRYQFIVNALGNLRQFDLETQKDVDNWSLHPKTISAICQTSDSGFIMTGDVNGNLFEWSIQGHKLENIWSENSVEKPIDAINSTQYNDELAHHCSIYSLEICDAIYTFTETFDYEN